MIIVLPIKRAFINKEPGWERLTDALGINAQYLAEMTLRYSDNKALFLNEVVNWIYGAMDDAVIEDVCHTESSDFSLMRFLESEAFKLFLKSFYDEHRESYQELLGINLEGLEWSQLYDHTLHLKDKLIVNVES